MASLPNSARHRPEARSNLVQTPHPRKCAARFAVRVGGGAPAARGHAARASRGPFRANPPHGIQHPVRRIHPIQIFRHLRAQKSPRHRMLRITLNLRRPPILHRDQHSASVRAVVRTCGMDNLSSCSNYRGRPKVETSALYCLATAARSDTICTITSRIVDRKPRAVPHDSRKTDGPKAVRQY